MAAQVYRFHISYEGLEDRIWRIVEVSSNYQLDRLGYMMLALFDTMAYHLFKFYYNDSCFEIPYEDSPFEQVDMATVRLAQIGIEIGDLIRMDYDFGTTQTFWLELVDITDMKRGQGNHYPYILDGAGRGIIDDMSCEELMRLMDQIDRKGQLDEEIYYKGRPVSWDYRWFDLDCMNKLLKYEIGSIEDGYAPFWQ